MAVGRKKLKIAMSGSVIIKVVERATKVILIRKMKIYIEFSTIFSILYR